MVMKPNVFLKKLCSALISYIQPFYSARTLSFIIHAYLYTVSYILNTFSSAKSTKLKEQKVSQCFESNFGQHLTESWGLKYHSYKEIDSASKPK